MRRRKSRPEEAIYKKVKYVTCTEKAIRFELVICYSNGPRDVKYIFAPKSLLKGDRLPYWFISKKYQEQVTPDMRGWLVWEDEEKERSAVVDVKQDPPAAEAENNLFDL